MAQKEEIIEAIKNGMKQACDDMYYFTNRPELAFNAEYLFTVATAKSIDKCNGLPAQPFEIRIEHSAKNFARDCLPLIKIISSGFKGKSILRKTPKLKRKGRIDIAIYSAPPQKVAFCDKIPLCAIELKGFNPQRAHVLKDLKRNIEFLTVKGPTGSSVLKFTVFAALHKINPSRNLDRLTENENEIKKKYESWMAELGWLNNVRETIETFTISSEPNGRLDEDYEDPYSSELDTSSRHHFIGVVVTFESSNII